MVTAKSALCLSTTSDEFMDMNSLLKARGYSAASSELIACCDAVEA